MSTAVPALSEDGLYPVISDQLELLGLRRGDKISIVPLDFYAVGDVVVALVDGFYQIGKLRQSDSVLELVTPQDDQTLVSQIDHGAIIGFVQKEQQEISVD